MSSSRVRAPRQRRAVETREALLAAAARVFARVPYDKARLKDIVNESGISEGALYFHFGNKDQIALAVLDAQQERMTAVLTESLASSASGLDKLLAVTQGLSTLMASDEIVQAGITLSSSLGTAFVRDSRDPYFEWIRIARTLIELGIEDGSVIESTDAASAAEFVNYCYVGAQVISGMADSWTSLPHRMASVESALRSLLAVKPT